MQDGDIEIYLQEISEFPLLTEERERALALRVRQNDMDAREEMIRANLRLVVSVARKYGNRSLPLLDLIAEGNLGLLKAVERYRPDMGRRFSTYATWWIKQAIRRALVSKVKNVRIPAYMAEMVARWNRASNELAQRLSRTPTPEEIASELGLSPSKIAAVRKAIGASHSSAFSRGASHRGDGDNGMDDALAHLDAHAPSPADGIAGDEAEKLEILLGVLPDRERTILEQRYGLGTEPPLTLDAIGARLVPPLTRERVRQLETVALKRLLEVLDRAEKHHHTP